MIINVYHDINRKSRQNGNFFLTFVIYILQYKVFGCLKIIKMSSQEIMILRNFYLRYY